MAKKPLKPFITPEAEATERAIDYAASASLLYEADIEKAEIRYHSKYVIISDDFLGSNGKFAMLIDKEFAKKAPNDSYLKIAKAMNMDKEAILKKAASKKGRKELDEMGLLISDMSASKARSEYVNSEIKKIDDTYFEPKVTAVAAREKYYNDKKEAFESEDLKEKLELENKLRHAIETAFEQLKTNTFKHQNWKEEDPPVRWEDRDFPDQTKALRTVAMLVADEVLNTVYPNETVKREKQGKANKKLSKSFAEPADLPGAVLYYQQHQSIDLYKIVSHKREILKSPPPKESPEKYTLFFKKHTHEMIEKTNIKTSIHQSVSVEKFNEICGTLEGEIKNYKGKENTMHDFHEGKIECAPEKDRQSSKKYEMNRVDELTQKKESILELQHFPDKIDILLTDAKTEDESLFLMVLSAKAVLDGLQRKEFNIEDCEHKPEAALKLYLIGLHLGLKPAFNQETLKAINDSHQKLHFPNRGELLFKDVYREATEAANRNDSDKIKSFIASLQVKVVEKNQPVSRSR